MNTQEYHHHLKELEMKRDEIIKKANECFNKKMNALNILYKDDESVPVSQQLANKQLIHQNANRRHGKPNYGDVSSVVAEIIKSLNIGETFTTQDVFKKLKEGGYAFKNSTISGFLKRLSKSEENGLKLTRRGKGSKPSHYKRIEDKSEN